MTDKERIEQIIQVKHLSNVEFCNQTIMSPSTLSHILSERTKPTIAILRNIVEAFPDLNPMWILLGQGEMFLDAAAASSEKQPDAPTAPGDIEDVFAPLRNGLTTSRQESSFGNPQHPASTPQQMVPPTSTIDVEEVVGMTLARLQKPQRKVTEVRIFFDDGTYETFSAS